MTELRYRWRRFGNLPPMEYLPRAVHAAYKKQRQVLSDWSHQKAAALKARSDIAIAERENERALRAAAIDGATERPKTIDVAELEADAAFEEARREVLNDHFMEADVALRTAIRDNADSLREGADSRLDEANAAYTEAIDALVKARGEFLSAKAFRGWVEEATLPDRITDEHGHQKQVQGVLNWEPLGGDRGQWRTTPGSPHVAAGTIVASMRQEASGEAEKRHTTTARGFD